MRLLVCLLVGLAVPFTLARDVPSVDEDNNGLASDEYYEYYEVEEDMDHEVPERLRQYIKSLPNPLAVETNYSPHDDLISSSGKVHESKYGRELNTQNSSKQHKRLGKHQKHHKRQRQHEQQKNEKDIKHHKMPDNTELSEATHTISDNLFMDKNEEKIDGGSHSDKFSKEKSSGTSLYSPENESLVIHDGNEKLIGTVHDENKEQTVKLFNYLHERDHLNVDNNFVSNLPGEKSNQQGEVEHTTMSEFTHSIPSEDKTVECKTGVKCPKGNKKDDFSITLKTMFNRTKKLNLSNEDNDKYNIVVAEQKVNSLDGSDSNITLSGSINSTVQTNEADEYENSHFTPGSGTDRKEQTGESPISAIRQTYADAVAKGPNRQELSTGVLKNNSLQKSSKIKEFSQTFSNAVTDSNANTESIQDQYARNVPSNTYDTRNVSNKKIRDDLYHSGYSSSINNYDHSIIKNNSSSMLDSEIMNNNNMEIIKTNVNDNKQYKEQILQNNNKNKINGETLTISNGTKNDHDELIEDLMTQMTNKTTKKTTKKRVKKRQRNNSKSKQHSQVTINDMEVEASGDRDTDASDLLTELNMQMTQQPIRDTVRQDGSDNLIYETYNYSQSNGQIGRVSNLLHEEENGNVGKSKLTSSIFKKSTDVLSNDLTGSNVSDGNVKKNVQYPKKVEVFAHSPPDLAESNREDSENQYLINTSSPLKSFNYTIVTKEGGGSVDHTSNAHGVNHDNQHSMVSHSNLTLNSGINVNKVDITKQLVGGKQYNEETTESNNKINAKNFISSNGINSDHKQVIEDFLSHKTKKATTKTIKKRIKKRRRNKSKQQQSQVNFNNTEITTLEDGDENDSKLDSQTELDDLKPFPDGGQGRHGNEEFVNTSFSNQSNGQNGRFSNLLPEDDHKSVGTNVEPSSLIFENPPHKLANDLTKSELSNSNLINNVQKANEFAHTSSDFVTEKSVQKADIQNLPSHSMLEDDNSILISGIDVNNMEINKQLVSNSKQYTKDSNDKINKDYFITSNGTKNDHEQVIEDFIGHLAKKATKKTIKKRIKKKFRNKSKTKQKLTTKESFKKTKNTKLMEMSDKESDNVATHTEDIHQKNPIDGFSQEKIDDNKHVVHKIEAATGNNVASSLVANKDIATNKSDYVLQTNKNFIEHKNLTANTSESFNQNEGLNNVHSEVSESPEVDMTKDSKKEELYMGQTEGEHVNTTQTHSTIQENINEISGSNQGKLELNVFNYKPFINKNPTGSKILEGLTRRPVNDTRNVVSNNNDIVSGDAKEMNLINGKVYQAKNVVTNSKYVVSGDAKGRNSIDGKVKYTRNVVTDYNDIVSGDAKETNSIGGKVDHTQNLVINNKYIVSGDMKETNSIGGKVEGTRDVVNDNSDIVSVDAKETNSIGGKVEGTRDVVNDNSDIVSVDAKETNSIDGKVDHTKNLVSNNKYIVSGDVKEMNTIGGKVERTRDVVTGYNDIVSGDAKETNSINGKVDQTQNLVSNNKYIVSGDAKETNSIDGKVDQTQNLVSNNKYIVAGDGKETNTIGGKVERTRDVETDYLVSGDAKETNPIDGKVKRTRNLVSNYNYIVSGDAKETNSIGGKPHSNASSDQDVSITSNALTSNFKTNLVEHTADREIRDDFMSETHSGTIFESNENNEVSQTNADKYSKTESDVENTISNDCLNNNCMFMPHIKRTKQETSLHSKFVPQEGNGRAKFGSVKSNTENTKKYGTKYVSSIPQKKGCPSNVFEHKTDTEVHKGANGCTNVICSINALKLSNLCKNINKIINLADQDETGSTYEIVIKVQTNSNGEQNNDKLMNEGTEQIKTNIKNSGSELNSLTKFIHDDQFMNNINNEEYKLNTISNENSQISKNQTKVKSPVKIDMMKLDRSNEFSKMNIDSLPLDTVIEEDITTKIKTRAGNRLVSKITRKKSVTRSQPLGDSVTNQFNRNKTN